MKFNHIIKLSMPLVKKILETLASATFLGIVVTIGCTYLTLKFFNAPDCNDCADQNALIKILRISHFKSVDLRLQARGPRKGSPQVAILAVDEKSVEQEGRWPWPREKIKRVVESMMKLGAKVLAFDIIFSEEDNNATVLALNRIKSQSSQYPVLAEKIDFEISQANSDQILASAVSEYGDRLVMGAYFDNPASTYLLGYQDLCVGQLNKKEESYQYWENEALPVIVVDRTAVDIADEAPSSLAEALSSYFDQIAQKITHQYLTDHNLKAGEPLNKIQQIEISELVRNEQWRYCGRWLETQASSQTNSDEHYSTYQSLWETIRSEDETLKDYNFLSGIEFFKNRHLTLSVHRTGRWWLNYDSIASVTKHTGYFNAFQDSDGTIRKTHLIVHSGHQYLPSLALKTYLVANQYTAEVSIDLDPKLMGYKGVSGITIRNEDAEPITTIPADSQGRVIINFAGKQHMFPHLSVADVLNPLETATITQWQQDPKTLQWEELTTKVNKADFIKDKIFIIGATAVGIYDLRVTPFEENYPGLETHANIVDNLIRGDFLTNHPDEEPKMLVSMILLGVLLSYLIGRLGALAGLILTVLTSIAIFIIDRYFFNQGIITTIIFPFLLTYSIYFSLTFYKYFTEEKKKRELKGTFEKYVSPAIVNEVLKDPSNIQLGGRKETITVFFSDVRGFTTISEKLDPEALSDLLNSYLTPMTKIVFDNKGTLDKYMGDAIMAFFGAPIHFADHAKHACRCALQNVEKLKELQLEYQKQGLPIIDIGIGLNTGEMCVGNMGSDIVRNYTVMGDAVNLGSRLEGINKQYGTRIIISEFTQKEIKNDFVTREIDWVRVKGKILPVRIFELMAENKVETKIQETLKWYDEGFQKYHQRHWDQALDSFQKALSMTPNDPVAKLYVERCMDYKQTPPPDQWDGVFIMTSK